MNIQQAAQVHPDVVVAPFVVCVGGPCDGQRMQNPIGRVLIVKLNMGTFESAVSLPPTYIKMAKTLGTYGGHYECGDDQLLWVAPE